MIIIDQLQRLPICFPKDNLTSKLKYCNADARWCITQKLHISHWGISYGIQFHSMYKMNAIPIIRINRIQIEMKHKICECVLLNFKDLRWKVCLNSYDWKWVN